MGWCSASEIFDFILKETEPNKPQSRDQLIERLFNFFRNEDWDCEGDLAIMNPEFKVWFAAYRKKHGMDDE